MTGTEDLLLHAEGIFCLPELEKLNELEDKIAETDGYQLTKGASEDQQVIVAVLKKKLENVA